MWSLIHVSLIIFTKNREIREYSHHALKKTDGGIRKGIEERSSGNTIPLPLGLSWSSHHGISIALAEVQCTSPRILVPQPLPSHREKPDINQVVQSYEDKRPPSLIHLLHVCPLHNPENLEPYKRWNFMWPNSMLWVTLRNINDLGKLMLKVGEKRI